MTLDRAALDELARIGTATLSTQLVKRGIRRHRIRGAAPLRPDQRIAGPAFTLRFLPGREDLPMADVVGRPGGLVEAIETAPPGSVLVIETQGDRDGGVLGDILADRARIRGLAGAVSDGVMRDRFGLERVGFPLWCAGLAPPPSFVSLFFAGYGMPVGVGGTAVLPGDLVVADADGAIVLPAALASDLLAAAREQDAFERWVIAEVARGRPLPGLYPPDDATRAEYEAARRG